MAAHTPSPAAVLQFAKTSTAIIESNSTTLYQTAASLRIAVPPSGSIATYHRACAAG
jgi:hypothetical protein